MTNGMSQEAAVALSLGACGADWPKTVCGTKRTGSELAAPPRTGGRRSSSYAGAEDLGHRCCQPRAFVTLAVDSPATEEDVLHVQVAVARI
jgi:hypothetical protein